MSKEQKNLIFTSLIIRIVAAIISILSIILIGPKKIPGVFLGNFVNLVLFIIFIYQVIIITLRILKPDSKSMTVFSIVLDLFLGAYLIYFFSCYSYLLAFMIFIIPLIDSLIIFNKILYTLIAEITLILSLFFHFIKGIKLYRWTSDNISLAIVMFILQFALGLFIILFINLISSFKKNYQKESRQKEEEINLLREELSFNREENEKLYSQLAELQSSLEEAKIENQYNLEKIKKEKEDQLYNLKKDTEILHKELKIANNKLQKAYQEIEEKQAKIEELIQELENKSEELNQFYRQLENLSYNHQLILDNLTLIYTSNNVKELFEVVKEFFAKLFSYKNLIIFIYNEEKDILNVEYADTPHKDYFNGYYVEMSEDMVGISAAHRQTIIIENKVIKLQQFGEISGILPSDKSAVSIPLYIDTTTLGVIYISTNEVKAYNWEQLSPVLPIINHISIALYKLIYKDDSQSQKQLKIVGPYLPDTNIYIPQYFKEKIIEEYKRSRRYNLPLTLMIITVDKLNLWKDEEKKVIIENILDILQNHTREVDILGFVNDEILGALLVNTPKAGGILVAERIKLAASMRKIKINNRKYSITVSIAVIAYQEVVDGELYLDTALHLLYEALKEGNKVNYIP